MRPKEILHELARYLNELLALAAHPQAGWSATRRAFAHRLLVGLVMAGDVMLTAIVRHFPGRVAMRHRYKVADRMLAKVDLVPVARQQAAVLGRQVGPDHVIAIDLSDIHKRYATKMEALSLVYDGSEGEVAVPGYWLVTASAFDTASGKKALPLPLLFETYSTVTEDFISETAIWLDTIDHVCDATDHGVIAIDRAGDNRRILRRLVGRGRDFVVRIKAGRSGRNLIVHGRKMLVSYAIRQASYRGEVEVERQSEDGRRSTFRARMSSVQVQVPRIDKQLWLCIFDSDAHELPIAVLTSLDARSPDRLSKVLAMYFGRWVSEEMHRFAKQAFKVENVRTLNWKRTRNLVAMTAIAMGAMARIASLPSATMAIRVFEVAAQRVLKPLEPGQFWGYTLAAGAAAALRRSHRLLPLMPWLLPPKRPPDPQLRLI